MSEIEYRPFGFPKMNPVRDEDIECCQDYQKTVERVELLMMIEYLTIVEIFRDMEKHPKSWVDEMVKDNPQLKVRQAAQYLDPQKVAKYYTQVARVLWLKPDMMDPTLFTEYLKFLLKDHTEEELIEKQESLARHFEGLDTSVRIVYRAMGEEITSGRSRTV